MKNKYRCTVFLFIYYVMNAFLWIIIYYERIAIYDSFNNIPVSRFGYISPWINVSNFPRMIRGVNYDFYEKRNGVYKTYIYTIEFEQIRPVDQNNNILTLDRPFFRIRFNVINSIILLTFQIIAPFILLYVMIGVIKWKNHKQLSAK